MFLEVYIAHHNSMRDNDNDIFASYIIRVVKLSSRNVNYLVIAGAALLYVSVFLYIFSERDHPDAGHEFLCNVWE